MKVKFMGTEDYPRTWYAAEAFVRETRGVNNKSELYQILFISLTNYYLSNGKTPASLIRDLKLARGN